MRLWQAIETVAGEGGTHCFCDEVRKLFPKGAWLKPVVLFRHVRLNRTKLPTWSNQSETLRLPTDNNKCVWPVHRNGWVFQIATFWSPKIRFIPLFSWNINQCCPVPWNIFGCSLGPQKTPVAPFTVRAGNMGRNKAPYEKVPDSVA